MERFHRAAQSADTASACSSTVRVAFFCLSGGQPDVRKIRFTSTRSVQSMFFAAGAGFAHFPDELDQFLDHLSGFDGPNRPVICAVLHRHAVHSHSVESAVAGLQCRPFRAGQPAEGIVQRGGGKVVIQEREGIAQMLFQYHLPVVGAMSGPWATFQPTPASQSSAASSTVDSVMAGVIRVFSSMDP